MIDKTDLRYQVSPDIRFRDLDPGLNRLKRPLQFSWFVTTREDVAGFPIALTNATSGTKMVEEIAPYTTRSKVYPGIPEGEYHLCIWAISSKGVQRDIQPAQCARISLSGAICWHCDLVFTMMSVISVVLLN